MSIETRRRPYFSKGTFYPTDRLEALKLKAKTLRDEAATAYEFSGANSYAHSLLAMAELVNAAVEDVQDVKWRTKREEG
jgi:hypothetical protein